MNAYAIEGQVLFPFDHSVSKFNTLERTILYKNRSVQSSVSA